MEKKRHIHTKEQIPKFFGNIVANQIKPILAKNTSPFQIGGMPGHRVQEHLFSLKSILAMTEKREESIALQILDYSKYFDSESLRDCLDELYKSEIRGRLYKLVFELNKDTRIKVTRPEVSEVDPQK